LQIYRKHTKRLAVVATYTNDCTTALV